MAVQLGLAAVAEAPRPMALLPNLRPVATNPKPVAEPEQVDQPLACARVAWGLCGVPGVVAARWAGTQRQFPWPARPNDSIVFLRSWMVAMCTLFFDVRLGEFTAIARRQSLRRRRSWNTRHGAPLVRPRRNRIRKKTPRLATGVILLVGRAIARRLAWFDPQYRGTRRSWKVLSSIQVRFAPAAPWRSFDLAQIGPFLRSAVELTIAAPRPIAGLFFPSQPPPFESPPRTEMD